MDGDFSIPARSAVASLITSHHTGHHNSSHPPFPSSGSGSQHHKLPVPTEDPETQSSTPHQAGSSAISILGPSARHLRCDRIPILRCATGRGGVVGVTWDVRWCLCDAQLLGIEWSRLAMVGWNRGGALCDAVGVEIAVLGGLKEAFLCYAPAGSSVSFRSCVWLDADIEGGSYLVRVALAMAVCLGREGGSAGASYTVRLCVLVGRSGCCCVPCVHEVRAAGRIDFFLSFFLSAVGMGLRAVDAVVVMWDGGY
jgi:hypothetical protein